MHRSHTHFEVTASQRWRRRGTREGRRKVGKRETAMIRSRDWKGRRTERKGDPDTIPDGPKSAQIRHSALTRRVDSPDRHRPIDSSEGAASRPSDPLCALGTPDGGETSIAQPWDCLTTWERDAKACACVRALSWAPPHEGRVSRLEGKVKGSDEVADALVFSWRSGGQRLRGQARGRRGGGGRMEGDLAEEEESRRTRDEERAIREAEALEKRASSTSKKSPKPKVSSEVRQRATPRSVSFSLGESRP